MMLKFPIEDILWSSGIELPEEEIGGGGIGPGEGIELPEIPLDFTEEDEPLA